MPTTLIPSAGRGATVEAPSLSSLTELDRVVVAMSLNKAFGAVGGALAFPNAELRDRVRRCGGPLIFSGPISPAGLGSGLASAKLHLSAQFKEMQEELHELVAFARSEVAEAGIRAGHGIGHAHPHGALRLGARSARRRTWPARARLFRVPQHLPRRARQQAEHAVYHQPSQFLRGHPRPRERPGRSDGAPPLYSGIVRPEEVERQSVLTYSGKRLQQPTCRSLLSQCTIRFPGKTRAMATDHKPKDYPSVSPYLVVKGAARTIQFLKETFDAVELRSFPDDEGKLMHAEVRIDDSVVMLGDSAPSWPPTNAQVHVYVPDVERHVSPGARRRRDFGPRARQKARRGQARRGDGSRRDHLVDLHPNRLRYCVAEPKRRGPDLTDLDDSRVPFRCYIWARCSRGTFPCSGPSRAAVSAVRRSSRFWPGGGDRDRFISEEATRRSKQRDRLSPNRNADRRSGARAPGGRSGHAPGATLRTRSRTTPPRHTQNRVAPLPTSWCVWKPHTARGSPPLLRWTLPRTPVASSRRRRAPKRTQPRSPLPCHRARNPPQLSPLPLQRRRPRRKSTPTLTRQPRQKPNADRSSLPETTRSPATSTSTSATAIKPPTSAMCIEGNVVLVQAPPVYPVYGYPQVFAPPPRSRGASVAYTNGGVSASFTTRGVTPQRAPAFASSWTVPNDRLGYDSALVPMLK